jgi:hypothetical protein
MRRRVKEEGEREGRSVMERIGAAAVSMTPTRKGADFPLVLVYVNCLANRLEEAKQIGRRRAKLLLVELPTVPLLAPAQ